jgi:hypothetical protein
MLFSVKLIPLSGPFFTHHKTFQFDGESDDDNDNDSGMSSQNDDDSPSDCMHKIGDGSLCKCGFCKQIIIQLLDSFVAWFIQPKYMPDWLYHYFGETVRPLIHSRNGRHLVKPPLFTESRNYAPASFWIYPPEPVIMLSSHKFDPQTLYCPRIFLWLPHFYVTELRCLKCSGLLEKNGALAPHQITDVEDNFYIVTWAYYCQKGCWSHFHGWSEKLLSTLPAYIRLAFPAILSYNGGLSHQVITQLQVGNQHKMGPNGVHALLCEMHTLHFNVLHAQYLEALFDLVHGHQAADMIQTTLHQ